MENETLVISPFDTTFFPGALTESFITEKSVASIFRSSIRVSLAYVIIGIIGLYLYLKFVTFNELSNMVFNLNFY